MINKLLSDLFNNKSKPTPKPKKPKKAQNTEGSRTAIEQTTWLIQGQNVPVEVHRERRGNVRVSFGKDKLILRTSTLVTREEEAKAVLQLQAAIEKQVEKKPDLLARFVQTTYRNGDSLTVGNKTYFLNIETDDRKSHSAKVGKNGVIDFKLAAADTEAGQQKAISTLLSRTISQDNLPSFSRRVSELNHQFFKKNIKSINFKYNHTNWGSCSSTGNLNFSSRLLFAPDDVQDYVIIHELAHLTEMNHSDRFWKLVSDAMPDYDEKEKWLKVKGFLCRF